MKSVPPVKQKLFLKVIDQSTAEAFVHEDVTKCRKKTLHGTNN